MSSSTFRLAKNLTIIGAPGSGKGFYGKPIAAAWNVPLLTSSSILRHQASDLDLDSGKLVDCKTVSDILLGYLETNISNGHYMVDGFPRTLKQVQLMKDEWPLHLQIHAAVHLDIPDFVCKAKMMGRRHCPLCNKDFNVAGVYRDGFDLPPQMPANCDQCGLKQDDWTRRPDDIAEIVEERLRVHHEHEQPILDYYESRDRLLKLTPYKGEKDIPYLQSSMEEWLNSLED